MQLLRQVKLELLAESLPLPIQFESRRKKLRRFLRLEIITIEKIWFPCLKELLKKEERFSINGLVYVAIDRTSWGVINILMVSLEMSIAAYQRRFDIEEMFRDFKSGGYSLEGSGLSEKYLSKLLIVVSIAYTSATLQGQAIKKMGIQKYVARPETRERRQRRHSSFYVGQHLHHWVQLHQMFQKSIEQLMQISRHRWSDYIKGKRAIQLALSTF